MGVDRFATSLYGIGEAARAWSQQRAGEPAAVHRRRCPQYRVAEVTVDADHAFGRPRFAHGGAALDDVIDLFRAGEPVDAVAGEFGLTREAA
jgi:uncharacterized protein (DUF433 family)